MQPMMAKIFIVVCILIVFAGCTGKYDECIENEKAQYRVQNPNASYGQVQSRQADFELMCSKFKAK